MHKLMLIIFALAGALHAQSYVVSSGTATTASIVGMWQTPNFHLGDDEMSPPVQPGGWSFNYFGQTITEFRISTNGYIVLGNGGGSVPPAAPSHVAVGGNVIAPCWTDLDGTGAYGAWVSDGPFYWMLIGNICYVEYWCVPAKGGGVVFAQIAMDAYDSSITLAYGNIGNGITSLAPQGVSISGPAATEIICGVDPGYIATDGSFAAWPGMRQVRFEPAQLAITTTSPLPAGNEGFSYNVQFEADGGTPAYTWSATGLPAAWGVDSAGVLSAPGNAAVAGSYSFQVTVQDSANPAGMVTATFVVDIQVVPPPLSIQSPNLPPAFTGQAYAGTLTAVNGVGALVWTLVAGALPPGITGLPSNSNPSVSLWGTPTTTGTYQFTVQVEDSAARTETVSCTITVQAAGISNGGSGGDSSGCATGNSGPAWAWLLAALPAGLWRALRWRGASRA